MLNTLVTAVVYVAALPLVALGLWWAWQDYLDTFPEDRH